MPPRGKGGKGATPSPGYLAGVRAALAAAKAAPGTRIAVQIPRQQGAPGRPQQQQQQQQRNLPARNLVASRAPPASRARPAQPVAPIELEDDDDEVVAQNPAFVDYEVEQDAAEAADDVPEPEVEEEMPEPEIGEAEEGEQVAELDEQGAELDGQGAGEEEQLLLDEAESELAAAETEARREIRRKEREEYEAEAVRDMVMEASTKLDALEAELEHVLIAAVPLETESGSPFQPEVSDVISDIEEKVKPAQAALGEARRFLNTQTTLAEKFLPDVKELALKDLDDLKGRLEAASTSLAPYQTIRRDHERRERGSKMVQEFSEKVGSCEAEVERLAVASVPMGGEGPTWAKDTEAALNAVNMKILQTCQNIELKLKIGVRDSDPICEELQSFLERATKAKEQLQDIQVVAKQSLNQMVSDALLQEVLEKVDAAEYMLQNVVGEAVPWTEEAAMTAKVNVAFAQAQTCTSVKLREAMQLPKDIAGSLKEQIEKLQKRVEEGRRQLLEFKAGAGDRQRARAHRELEQEVERVESEVKSALEVEARLVPEADTLGEEERVKLVSELEAAVSSARARVTDAQAAMAKKVVEMQSSTCKSKFQSYKQQVESATLQLSDLEQRSAARTCTAAIRPSEEALAKAEKITEEFSRAMAKFSDDALRSLASNHVRAVFKGLARAETEAKASVAGVAQVLARLKQETASWKAELQKRLSAEMVALQSKVRQCELKLGAISRQLKGRRECFLAEALFQTAVGAVDSVEAKVGKIIEDAMAGSPEQFESIKQACDEAIQGTSEAQLMVAQTVDAHNASSEKPDQNTDRGKQLRELTERIGSVDYKSRMNARLVHSAYKKMARIATKKARAALRGAAQRGQKSSDELFSEIVAGEGDEMTEARFVGYLIDQPQHGLNKEQAAVAFREFGGPGGLRKAGFSRALQEYLVCAASVAFSPCPGAAEEPAGPAAGAALEPGEAVELLEVHKEDDLAAVEWAKVRRLRDTCVGRVELKDGQGAALMKPSERPQYWCKGELALQEGADRSSPTVRDLASGEIVELLEGPRDLEAHTEVVLRVRAQGGSLTGWITIRSKGEEAIATQTTSVYTCKTAIAMTDTLDLKNCKVLRRVSAGETLESLPGQVAEPALSTAETVRMQLRTVDDGKEGWVTVRGNQGTTFLDAGRARYRLDRDAALRAGAAAGAEVLASLPEGEVLEALEAPREEVPPARQSRRVRALRDGTTGWVTCLASATPGPLLLPWAPRYTCRRAVPFTPGPASAPKGSAAEAPGPTVAALIASRQAEPGRTYDAIEGPLVEPGTSLLRVRCATAEDGVIGWATIRQADGDAFLEPA